MNLRTFEMKSYHQEQPYLPAILPETPRLATFVMTSRLRLYVPLDSRCHDEGHLTELHEPDLEPIAIQDGLPCRAAEGRISSRALEESTQSKASCVETVNAPERCREDDT